eukprot:8213517-Pyramimonas_sp.AAC.1
MTSLACQRHDASQIMPCGAPSSSSLPSGASRSFSSSFVDAVVRAVSREMDFARATSVRAPMNAMNVSEGPHAATALATL